MRSILYIRCSPREADSYSGRFADEVLARLRQMHPAATVHRRDLTEHPPPLVDATFAAAVFNRATPSDAFDHSEALIRELEQADTLVIATPMHNYTVPAVLKAWIDQVVRINRTFASRPTGKAGLLRDRLVLVVIASGSWFSGPSPTGTPAQPDFLTHYLRAILGTIGLNDIHFLTLEWVARGPAMVERAMVQARKVLDDVLTSPEHRSPARR